MNAQFNNKAISVILFLFGFSLTVSTFLQSISMVCLLVFALMSSEVRANLKFAIKEPFIKISLLIYALFILGTLWTSAAIKDALHMLVKADIFLIAPVIFAIFYQPKYKISLYYGFACGVMLAVVISLVAYLFHLGFFTESGVHFYIYGKALRVFHSHTYQNYFAGLLSVGLLSILLEEQLTKFRRALYIIVISLCAFDIFFVIHGRGGQILYLLMLVILLLQWRFKLGMFFSAVILLLVVPLFVAFSPVVKHGIELYNSDLTKYQNGNFDTSMGGRWEFHKYSWQLIKHSPILGYGTGSYSNEYQSVTTKVSTTNPHNDYLWFGVELGVCGILLLVAFIFIAFKQAYRLVLPYRYIGIILVATYAVACFQNSFFTDRITGEAFIVFISSLLASSRYQKKTSLHNDNMKEYK